MLWLNIKIALQALFVNKMRSLLTMLGIIIGVCSVIIMISLGEVTRHNIYKQWADLGTNTIYVNNSQEARTGIQRIQGTRKYLQYDDVTAIQEECPSVLYASPVSTTPVLAVYRDQNWNTTIYGVSDTFFAIENLETEEGRLFSDRDVDNSYKVCVIAKKSAENLFPGENPLGKIIRVKGVPLTVIGVLKEKGQSKGGAEAEDKILIPSTTYKIYIDGSRYVGFIEVLAQSTLSIGAACDEIRGLLRERYKKSESGADVFEIKTLLELLKSAQASLGMIALFLVFVSSISLIVGGIGIMNIMLVSVTERIREIGVRMAIGAKGRDIMLQFLVESVVLCMVGGLIGLTLGFLITIAIETAYKWPLMFSFSAVLVSLSFSVAVGVIFGFFPALKASRLDPIEALKSE
ncbi:MAG: ABC transporter permease [Candidatus Eremiobacteraeota bacterium]|nr:ABC transporter permease [Candidatus Eremiobacteraeota bacterium]